MAFNTSNDDFDLLFGEETQTPSERFHTDLMSYLRTKSNVPSAVKMAEWLADDKPVIAFKCRENVGLSVVEKLYENKIPYVTMISESGKLGFILRQCDKEAVEKANEEVLHEKSRFCTVISGSQMAKQASQSRETDKSCLVVHGLSRSQAEIMKRKYAQYFEAPKIGLDRRHDGTYDFTVFGRESVKRNSRGGPDICTLFLETLLETGGPDEARVNAEANMHSIFIERLAKNFDDPEINMNKMPLWIIGAGMNYMKVTSSEFVYGHVTIARNRELDFNQDAHASALQPDYREMLVSYAARFYNPIMTYNMSEVISHFGGANDSNHLGPSSLLPNSKSRAWARGEHEMSLLIDKMLTRKIAGDPIMTMEGRWGEKFQHYANTAKEFMASLTTGRVPKGYEQSEISSLQEIMDKHGLEGSMFSKVSKNFTKINAITISDTRDRITNVAERIGESRDAIEKEKAREKAARMERTGRGSARAFGREGE